MASHNLLHFDSDPPAPTAYAYADDSDEPDKETAGGVERIRTSPNSGSAAYSSTALATAPPVPGVSAAATTNSNNATDMQLQLQVQVNSGANSAASGSDRTHDPTRGLNFQHIVVPLRIINFYADIKFEEDPFSVTLHGIMTPKEYTATVRRLNDALKPCRATGVDHALLLLGSSMLTLIPWAMRSKANKKMRREIIRREVEQFNDDNPHLVMRWQTKPAKCLIIMRHEDYVDQAAK